MTQYKAKCVLLLIYATYEYIVPVRSRPRSRVLYPPGAAS
jgi:hypothetical protein